LCHLLHGSNFLKIYIAFLLVETDIFLIIYADLTPGKQINAGKTKQILDLPKLPGAVLVQSMDKITAGDGARAHDLPEKAAISTATTCKVFELLNNVGVKTHYMKRASETAFVAKKCDMVPIEWVTRRVATGSFLNRNEGVKEGYRFNPPKQETFFKVTPFIH
jgi:phosphoribosylaminoimidazole carboxylase/phosphoribosylaminoimidazole-succinocarboxamide synthase